MGPGADDVILCAGDMTIADVIITDADDAGGRGHARTGDIIKSCQPRAACHALFP